MGELSADDEFVDEAELHRDVGINGVDSDDEADPFAEHDGEPSESQAHPVLAAPDAEAPPGPPGPVPPAADGYDFPWYTFMCDYGKITWYQKKGGFFEATCKNRGHGRCVLTRTAHASARSLADGRPLGLLYAWLCADHCDSQPQHLARGVFLETDAEARLAARQALQAFLAAAPLFAKERPLREGEAIEPGHV